MLIAGEILKQLKPFVDEEVHSRVIIRALRKATQLSVDYIEKLAVRVFNQIMFVWQVLIRAYILD